MISGVFVENFMRIDQRVSIDLGPVTVLVGANGSGKSSILKAIHWSVRCATLRSNNNNTTLEQMDYTPSREFLQLAHKKRIQNSEGMPKIIVGFLDSEGEETVIQLSAARNDAGAKALINGPLSGIMTAATPQTAYIPGLAGLAETETLLATPILHRRAASGEGGAVLRHILLELVPGSSGAGTGTDHVELTELNKWVGKVIPGIRFWIKFDRLRDINIDAQFLTQDMHSPGRNIAQQRKPLEMAGTGFLQIVQIFAYLLKFKPRLLLIDEPDAHLHPGTQELLIKAIEEATIEFPETQFIITTHSPSLVRACSEKTKVRWMDRGALRSENETTIRQRMGWGALDKELILFTEDEKTVLIQGIIEQWPSLARKIIVWPTFGSSGLPHGDALRKLSQTLDISAMVHRDRDFMSDADINEWRKNRKYEENGIRSWITDGSDIESSFCDAKHLASLLSIDDSEGEEFLKAALLLCNKDDVERDFNTALSSAVATFPAPLRSIPSARWRELGEFCQNTVKGKEFLSMIKKAVQNSYKDTIDAPRLARLSKLRSPTPGLEVCASLKVEIEAALTKAKPASSPA
ncbi:ATP-dependent nuclease [Bosea vaviloviae]|uniref:ATP-dependent nuclease n=1 Tax=Bosea vaviloviae TaxID=1526658 RepID=UPI0024A66225|nr:AAA family ATPase [Bosea vaviloviae]